MSIIAFDLDDVICSRTSNEGKAEKYHTCYPLESMIEIVNKCHDQGHTIIIYTARGMSSYKGDRDLVYHNLYDLTVNQLKEWGVKYDRLIMGKAHYDILIDDKAVNSYTITQAADIEEFLEKK